VRPPSDSTRKPSGEPAGEHRETARLDGYDIGIGLTVTGTIFTARSG
jgi:hypothetical protein